MKLFTIHKFKIFFFFFSVISFVQTANSTTCVFTNSDKDDLWSNPNNWSTGFVPDADDDAHIGSKKVTVDLNIIINSLTMSNGAEVTFTHSDTAFIGTLNITGGTLESINEIIINDYLNWTANSTITSSSKLILASTCVTNISGNSNRKLESQLINEGTLTYTGGKLRIRSGGSIINNSYFFVDGPSKIYDNGGGAFTNNGIFYHLSNASIEIQPEFNNNVEGTIQGVGSLNFDQLTNNGAVAPGITLGTLTLSGNYISGDSLKIELSGTLHDQLVIEGDISLSGVLETSGNVSDGTYTIISSTSGSITGTFDTENLPPNTIVEYNTTTVNLIVNSILPMELTDFRAQEKLEQVLLEWRTLSEINTARIVVEHSVDGLQFTQAGTVPAAGRSTDPIDYHFTHQSPEDGLNYYRLKLEDLDGQYEYSDLRVVEFYNYEKELLVYPNPTFGSIVVKNSSEKVFNIIIRDLSGKIVFAKNEIHPGATELDLKFLPKSMYIMDIYSGFISIKEKITILE